MPIIELSRKAYFHNLDIIAQKVGKHSKIAIVLKDNAYGHGLIEMAQLSFEYGLKKAVVHNVQEARVIKRYFDDILILAGDEYVVDEQFSYAINSLEQIEKMPKGINVELKVDTGMHRNGIAPNVLQKAVRTIVDRGLFLRGVMSHHRSADTLSSEWFWQEKNFESLKSEVLELQKRLGFKRPRFHTANSAAIFRDNSHHHDMVRVGIAAYGCLEMEQTLESPKLEPVLKLIAQKIVTRTLAKGEHVGYNATYRAEKALEVSTYDVGYADGLLRAASNHYVTPSGAQLLGRISMDNSTFTGCDEALVIFDDVNDYAKASGSIGYEVLTGLHFEIKREVV